MTDLDYLKEHPFTIALGDQGARISMIRCPSEACPDHPIVRVDDPPHDQLQLPYVSVEGALAGMLATAVSLIAKGLENDAWALARYTVEYAERLRAAVPDIPPGTLLN